MCLDKQYLNYQEQIAKLKSKKLIIDNEQFAYEMLQKYGYYSLICGYKEPFKNKVTKEYKAKSTFEDIVKLYEFDAELRCLFLKYLLLVEKQIKVHLTTAFCETFSELQADYTNPNNYWYDLDKNKKDIDKLVDQLKSLIRTKRYPYIEHAKKCHKNVPLWVILNAVSFGTISKIYQVQYQKVKSKIAMEYPFLNEGTLGSLLREASACRNVCAHSDRLYTFKTKEIIPRMNIHAKMNIPLNEQGDEYICGQRDLFAIVIVLRYMLSNEDFKKFKKYLSALIDGYVQSTQPDISQIVLKTMGFPSNWKSITKYRTL